MKSVSMVSSKLLVTAKSVSADPHAPNAKNQLSSAARAVTDSINGLLDVCTQSAPGQKECDSAIRNIEVNIYILLRSSFKFSEILFTSIFFILVNEKYA